MRGRGAGRGDPRQGRRPRRHRRFSARLFAVDQGGPGADGAGRGAAARARCRDRRPADRGQARRRPLARRRHQIHGAVGFGVGLDARRRRAHHPSGRNAGDDPRRHRQAARAAGAAHRDPPGDAADRLAFRARPDHRRSAGARPRPRRSSATRSTCSAKARAPRTTPQSYFDAYANAIEAIGASAGNAVWPARPGISVKLTALHPRFEAISRERVLAELPPRVIALARMAKAHELGFTIDAEEADRLELSLDVIGAVLGDPSLRGFEGFGLAVQAYQKRALGGDRLGRSGGRRVRQPADRPAGQGRLLGHRDQARAGARPARLSGVYPQGHDRSLLHGLRRRSCSPRAGASFRNSPPTTR